MSRPTQKVGLLTSSSLVIAAMIGTGVFTSIGFQVLDLKTGFSIMLLWIIGGIVAFCGATTYAELGSAFPKSGGEYSLLSSLVHPSVGFVAGWVSVTVGFAAPASIAAMALSSYLKNLIPNLHENHTSAGFIVILTLIHSKSLKIGTGFQDISTLLKIALILIFILSGFFISEPTQIQLFPQSESWSEILSPPFAVALVFVSYAYTGWNSTIYIVSDIDKPSNLPKSLFIGTFLVMLLYMLINYIFLYTVPISQLEGQIEVGYLAGKVIFGASGGQIMAAVISILLLSTVSAYVFLGPRVMEVMGQDFKALHWFSKTSANGIPVNAFIFSMTLSLLFIYTSTFDEVLIYTSFLLILIPIMTVASIFILRTKFRAVTARHKTWGYPLTPIIFLALNIWILTYLLMEKPYESTIALSILVIGLVLYFLTQRAQE